MENKTRERGMESREADFTEMPGKEFVAIMEKLKAGYPGDFKAFIRGMPGKSVVAVVCRPDRRKRDTLQVMQKV